MSSKPSIRRTDFAANPKLRQERISVTHVQQYEKHERNPTSRNETPRAWPGGIVAFREATVGIEPEKAAETLQEARGAS